jgi:hypothetical protein
MRLERLKSRCMMDYSTIFLGILIFLVFVIYIPWCVIHGLMLKHVGSGMTRWL